MTARERPRLLILCPYPEGIAAGQRLKYEQYLDDWRAMGFDIDVSPFMDISLWQVAFTRGARLEKARGISHGYLRRLRDLFRIHRYDVVYVFMWVTPFGTSLFERLVRLLAKRLVFDVEDNVLAEQTRPNSNHPNPIIGLLRSREKVRHLVRTADHVITSSPFLNDFCRKLNKKSCCTYISSSVDVGRFVPANHYANDRPVVIGWTGTFSSKEYLDLLRNVFSKLASRVPYKLKIIANFDYAYDGIDLEVVRWTKEREVQDLQDIDIGVYPLPINDWVLGKSGLKAIQYMAFGLPIVATDVGTTPLLITDNVNGLLVRTEEEWIVALEKLVHDPGLRKRLGEKARADAVANYSLPVIALQYRRVLQTTMGIAT